MSEVTWIVGVESGVHDRVADRDILDHKDAIARAERLAETLAPGQSVYVDQVVRTRVLTYATGEQEIHV